MNLAGTPLARIKAGLDDLPDWLQTLDGPALGQIAIELREVIDRTEAASADVLCRFEKSGAYAAGGALSMVAWMRGNCKLSGGAAAERVGIARQLEKLPQTRQAIARGEVGYQHVALMARTAENVGTAPVRQAEASLLPAAQTMDPGRFASVTKNFEHRVDAEGALAEANRAYARRYLQVSQPLDGLVRLEGLLDAEGGATLQTALNALMPPDQHDDRTPGQRRADALVELCRRGPNGPGPTAPARART